MLQDAKQELKTLWWVWMLIGTVSILFGIGTMVVPGLTTVQLFGMLIAFLLIWGVVELIQGFVQIKRNKKWWLTCLSGIAMICLATFLANHPGLSLATFAMLLGFFLVIRGTFDLCTAGFVDRDGKVWWIISSILGVIAGITVLVYPVSGTVAFVWVIGLYALINGAVMIARAVELRSTVKEAAKKVKK